MSEPVTKADAGDAEAVAVLSEPVRRALYEHVAARGEAVSRDEAATAVGIGRPLAAFHLDRLVAAGLLDAAYGRVNGRTGPGAGRPAKLYQRSSREFNASVPRREYLRAAQLLVEAVVGTASDGVKDALISAAHTLGESVARTADRPHPTRPPLRGDLLALLADQGYQPFMDAGGVIRMRNCPFHALSSSQPDLICGMNLGLVEGLLDGLGGAGAEAGLDPQPGLCCVALRPAPRQRRTAAQS
jgi:predicted ArsR family transcriptional regulator